MNSNVLPKQLCFKRFIAEGKPLEGSLSLPTLTRFWDALSALSGDYLDAEHLDSDSNHWMIWASVSIESDAADIRRFFLHLQGDLIAVVLTCQRCLGPLQTQIQPDFFADLQADLDKTDPCCSNGDNFLLYDWIEDELILSLPWFPKHDICPGFNENPLERD
jgi:uncharacterized metal-binding protein YceD (DUF177 family)